MTWPAPVMAALFLGFGFAAPALAQKRADQWSAPVDGLQARLWMMGPAPGEFRREKPILVQFDLQNASETPITLPASGNVWSAPLPPVTLHLTDASVIERELDLGTSKHETLRTGVLELAPGQATTTTLDVTALTQSKHWDWWQGTGLPTGAYTLALTFHIDRPVGLHGWRGAIRTNTIAFTVAEGSVYPVYRPDGEVEIVSRGPDGLPTHIAWHKDGGVVRERLISDGTNGWPRHLLAEAIHSAPGKTGAWAMTSEPIHIGGTISYLSLPRPDGHHPTALVRTWGLPLHDSATLIFTARYVNGRLHGPFEGRYNNFTMRGEYVEDRREGTWVTRSKTNVVVHKRAYRNGVLHGSLTSWYRGGKLRRDATYRDGALHGDERLWARDGTLIEIGHWTSGHRDGSFESWYADGTPRIVSSYADGIQTGTWRWYRRDGTLAAKGTWRNGAPWLGTFYRPNRSRALRPAMIARYKDGQLVESWPDVEH